MGVLCRVGGDRDVAFEDRPYEVECPVDGLDVDEFGDIPWVR